MGLQRRPHQRNCPPSKRRRRGQPHPFTPVIFFSTRTVSPSLSVPLLLLPKVTNRTIVRRVEIETLEAVRPRTGNRHDRDGPTPEEPGAMNPAETTARSALDKPLSELTEEDIAQLTREDCRRFLKSKGMRRPSWNKSQAIQQVISLKALMEGRSGCDDCPAGGGIVQKPRRPRPTPVPASPPQDSSPPHPPRDDGGLRQPPMEPSPYRRRDPISPPYSAGNHTCPIPLAVSDQPHPPPQIRCLSPRVTAELPAPGQMTIFYDGLVSVYEEVTVDQAKAVLELAASAVCFDDGPNSPVPQPAFRLPASLPESSAAPPFARAFPFSTAAGKVGHHAADGWEDGIVPRETEPEGTVTRKASLQRYLEKRKDRFKGKKFFGGSASSMEMMYYSPKLRYINTNELSNQNNKSLHTVPQLPPSPSRCSSVEYRVQREFFH